MTGVRALLALVLLTSAAAAQGTSALRRHDTGAPIDVDAQRIEVLDAQRQAIFSGDVRVKQGSLNLAANSLTIRYRREGENPVILRLDARGDVRMTSPSERARGDFGIYDVEERQLTLVGGVVLNQGQSVLRGQRLAIDLETGRSTLDGGGAPAAPGTAATPGGRVSGRFVVPERRP